MDEDRIRWDERYEGRSAPTASAPDVLADHPELLDVLPPSGRALDLACGVGAQTMWLAGKGFQVVALDVSPRAIELLRQTVRRDGLDARVDARVHDTDDGLPADLVDLSIIICQRYRSPALYPQFIDRLAVGGVLVLTVLSSVGLDGEPGEFHARRNELLDAYQRDDVDVVLHEERDGHASIVVTRTR